MDVSGSVRLLLRVTLESFRGDVRFLLRVMLLSFLSGGDGLRGDIFGGEGVTGRTSSAYALLRAHATSITAPVKTMISLKIPFTLELGVVAPKRLDIFSSDTFWLLHLKTMYRENRKQRPPQSETTPLKHL